MVWCFQHHAGVWGIVSFSGKQRGEVTVRSQLWQPGIDVCPPVFLKDWFGSRQLVLLNNEPHTLHTVLSQFIALQPNTSPLCWILACPEKITTIFLWPIVNKVYSTLLLKGQFTQTNLIVFCVLVFLNTKLGIKQIVWAALFHTSKGYDDDFYYQAPKKCNLFVMPSYHMASEDWKYWVKIIYGNICELLGFYLSILVVYIVFLFYTIDIKPNICFCVLETFHL